MIRWLVKYLFYKLDQAKKNAGSAQWGWVTLDSYYSPLAMQSPYAAHVSKHNRMKRCYHRVDSVYYLLYDATKFRVRDWYPCMLITGRPWVVA